MIDALEDDTEKKSVPAQIPGNLQLLVDIYKHHWDLFLKGFAFYLASCAVFASFVVSTKEAAPSIFQKLFTAGAVTVASLIALIGLTISYEFLNRIGNSIDALCEEFGYKKIYFSSPKKIVQLFRFTAGLFLAAGILYTLHIFLYEEGMSQLTKAGLFKK